MGAPYRALLEKLCKGLLQPDWPPAILARIGRLNNKQVASFLDGFSSLGKPLLTDGVFCLAFVVVTDIPELWLTVLILLWFP